MTRADIRDPGVDQPARSRPKTADAPVHASQTLDEAPDADTTAADVRADSAIRPDQTRGSPEPPGPTAQTGASPVRCAMFLKKMRTCASGLALTSSLFM